MSAQPGGVQAGVWTHLAGSYDGVEKQLRLFVNGELVGETSHNMTWTGSHGLQVGAGTYSGEVKSYFPGTVDEISLFDKRMWEPQVQALYEEGVTGVPGRPVVAHFDFEEPAGSPEVLGYAHVRPAVLHGGMELGASGPVTTSARLSGEGAYGSVGVPHLNTERSFTVSAWAKIDPGQHTEEKVVVSQLGTHRPGFTLYYSGVQNRWVFGTYRSDAPDADLIWTGQPAGSAVQGEWVHLVGVHDTEPFPTWLVRAG
ncbi:LamG-like jellyroll fold domain-containing protein, partial [Streptomyces sodiiphilus]|uniref:LamG-like jellyroll fold domain-containing protein n=1 Tax=Streptomyces sodiiphilus TaxID=226217 RepID=UPI0031E2D4F4